MQGMKLKRILPMQCNFPILEKILVCPVTHVPLEKIVIGNNEFFTAGEYRYPIVDGIANMVPTPPPIGLEKQWCVWKELQKNGAISYEMAPQLNLSAPESRLSSQFEAFIKLTPNDIILDVGCGPQKQMPAYISKGHLIQYVGIDPLVGGKKRVFPFVQGIGEAMPFIRECFDHILFHSSLDHMIDFRIVLKEAHRVLRTGGKISISSDYIVDEQKRSIFSSGIYMDIVRKGVKQIYNGVSVMGIASTIRYLMKIVKLRVPKGAIDYFHMHFPRVEELTGELKQLGFEKGEIQICDNQIFISAIKL